MNNTFKEIEQGQVWRQYNKIDLGEVIRWEVVFVNKKNNLALVVNQATLAELWCTIDSESSFTFDNELMKDEKPKLAHLPKYKAL